MRARVKADYISNVLRACGGTLFVKGQWTEVQPGQEKSALVNADLEVEVAGEIVFKDYTVELGSRPKWEPDAPATTEIETPKPVKKGRR